MHPYPGTRYPVPVPGTRTRSEIWKPKQFLPEISFRSVCVLESRKFCLHRGCQQRDFARSHSKNCWAPSWPLARTHRLLPPCPLWIFADRFVSGHSRFTFHTIRQGETLERLAERYGTSVASLKEWNDLAGQKFEVNSEYVVKIEHIDSRRRRLLSDLDQKTHANVDMDETFGSNHFTFHTAVLSQFIT